MSRDVYGRYYSLKQEVTNESPNFNSHLHTHDQQDKMSLSAIVRPEKKVIISQVINQMKSFQQDNIQCRENLLDFFYLLCSHTGHLNLVES